jgi:hypothetical protein
VREQVRRCCVTWKNDEDGYQEEGMRNGVQEGFLRAVLRIRIQDPLLFTPGIRDEFFPDPGSWIPDLFDYD